MTSINKFLDNLFEDLSFFISKDLQIDKNKLDASINKFRNNFIDQQTSLESGVEPTHKSSKKTSIHKSSKCLSKEEIDKLTTIKRNTIKAYNKGKYLSVNTYTEILPTSTYAKRKFVINDEYKIVGIKDSPEYLDALRLLDYDKENPEIYKEEELKRGQSANLLLNSIFDKKLQDIDSQPLSFKNEPLNNKEFQDEEESQDEVEEEDLDSLLSKFD